MSNVPLQVIGWIGSALLVLSLLQSRMLALRVLNLIAAILLIAYNLVLAVWPSVAMNAAVAAIDVFYLAWMARSAEIRRTRPASETGIDDRDGA